jgi:hypothetical protein
VNGGVGEWVDDWASEWSSLKRNQKVRESEDTWAPQS